MHITKLISGSMIAGVCVLSSAAHAEGEVVTSNVLMAPPPPAPVKRGKVGLVVTGTILSVAGTVHTVAGFAGIFGSSGYSSVGSSLLGGISLGIGAAFFGIGVPLIVYGATAKVTKKPRAEMCVSANGFLLRGTF